MEILKNFKQIEDKLIKIFNSDIKIDAEKFVKSNLSDEELKDIATNVNFVSKDGGAIDDFSDLIFQLRDYIFPLSNFVKLLLMVKDYEAIFMFVKKIFVGQIGQIKYSGNKEVYNYLERYFDRFIEIVKNCNIEKELYLPLILKAFESDKAELLYNWKRPALEFMQGFFNENEEWTLDYIKLNPENKYKLLEIITDFNTSRGIKMLIDDFIIEDRFNEDLNSHILKKYKRETFLELDKRLSESISDDIKERLACVFLSFGKDNEALTRLKDLYDKTDNENLKNIIADRLEIMENTEGKSEKQFLYTARRKIKEPQERTLGIPFDKINLKLKSGFQANNIALTYLINLFKEGKDITNLKNLGYIFNVFDEDDLSTFAEQLLSTLSVKKDIKEAKWAIRLIALCSNHDLAKELSDFAILLFADGRIKEGKYLTECLVNCGKSEAVKIFSEIDRDERVENDWKDEMFTILSKKSDIDIEELKDKLAIGKINPEETKRQAKRLFNAFLNNRKYKKEHFDLLSRVNPFKPLFERLVWGEYKNEKLYNAFTLENGQRDYKVKLLNEASENFYVSIIHTLDLDDRFDKVRDIIGRPLFEQFRHIKFDVKDYKSQTTELSSFSGMFVLVGNFIDKILKFDFTPNKNESEISFGSIININQELNLVCILEFNKPITTSQTHTNLSNIYFIKFSDVIQDQDKFIYSKSNAIPITNLPPRYFDYCMSGIFTSAQEI